MSHLNREPSDTPEAYATGEAYFYNEVYKVTPAVLIPRPDTERVVDKVIDYLPPNGKLLDLCTGSGCIAVSAMNARKDCTAVAVDISAAAVEIARHNAVINGAADRVEFVTADINTLDIAGKYDIIVSNPPYIRTDVIETLDVSVRDYEPITALDGGADGMDFYRLILNRFADNVKSGGLIIFEIGYDQADEIKKICGEATEIYKDYGGNDRVAVIKI